MYYWNHPNDKEAKVWTEQQTHSFIDFYFEIELSSDCCVLTSQKAEGSISLSTSSYQSVRPVKRDSCARPFTFELVSNVLQHQDDSLSALAK